MLQVNNTDWIKLLLAIMTPFASGSCFINYFAFIIIVEQISL